MAIATGTALALSAAAAAAGGYMSAQAAKEAASETAGATREAAQLQYQAGQQAREDLAAYRGLGYRALSELGGGMAGRQPIYDEQGNITGYQTGTGYLTGQLTPEKIAEYLDPAMAFRMKYGTQATERLGNVSGGALSGNTLRSLQEFGQNLASTEYAPAFNRAQAERTGIYNILANIAGMGQGSVNTGVQSNLATAQNVGALTVGGAQAQAAGTVGAANALTGGLQNTGNMLFLSQLLKPTPSTVAPANYSLSGAPRLDSMGGGTGVYLKSPGDVAG